MVKHSPSSGSEDPFDELDDSDIDLSDPVETKGINEADLFDEIDFDSLGIDPGAPTMAKPGSEEKVLMMAARFAAGIPLWHENDCYDHGPIGSRARSSE